MFFPLILATCIAGTSAVEYELVINGKALNYKKPIQYKFTDPVRGEIYNPIVISPAITASTDQTIVLSQNNTPQKVRVTFINEGSTKNRTENVSPVVNKNWIVTPNLVKLEYSENQQQISQEFTVQAQTKDTRLDTLSFRYGSNEKVKINRDIH